MRVAHFRGNQPCGGVAIIGMAGRFPGAANVDTFWENLCAGRETVSFFAPDELDPSLDPELTGEVLKVLEDMALSGMTMVLVTHEMGFARRFGSRAVFMHDGKIWEEGPASTTLAEPETPELKTFLSAVLH